MYKTYCLHPLSSFHSKFITLLLFKLVHHLQEVVHVSRLHLDYFLMMATPTLYQILFDSKACLFCVKYALILATSLCSMACTSNHTFCFWYGLCSSCRNNINFETWKVRCATQLVHNFNVYILGCGLNAKFCKAPCIWQGNVGPIHWVFEIFGCSTTHVAQFQTPHAFVLACFSYRFWTCSKNFLVQVYNFSHSLTIFTTSLEWSFCPMGMAKSIGFLTSFPNVNLNKNIFVVECVVEL